MEKKQARGPGEPQALTRNLKETGCQKHNKKRKKLPEMMNSAYTFFTDKHGIIQYRKK